MGCADWVDNELDYVNYYSTLRKAKLLDTIFLAKKQVVRVKAEFLRYVVRRWNTETHTFVYAWRELL